MSDNPNSKKRIAILGSTGSIGKQALEVIKAQSDILEAEVLVAGSNAELLVQQAIEFQPNSVVILDKKKYDFLKESLASYPIKVFCGESSVLEIMEWPGIDMVLSAFVGFAGLRSTLRALQCGKVVALANKESLVVGGELLIRESLKNKAPLLPVDSEHSAIFQCLTGETSDEVEKIILTASGGPFRGKDKNFLAQVTPEDALKHPNWNMGAKITIDSATLMNKGLEVIEARWLFGLEPSRIDVIIHPQSIIHSMVCFTDGSIKAQMGLPDMRLPIQYALCYPVRPKNYFPRYNFQSPGQLTFEKPDTVNFPCLSLAYEALSLEGNAPCILNAANEAVVELFLSRKISFNEIPDRIASAIHQFKITKEITLEQLIQTDTETRAYVKNL